MISWLDGRNLKLLTNDGSALTLCEVRKRNKVVLDGRYPTGIHALDCRQ